LKIFILTSALLFVTTACQHPVQRVDRVDGMTEAQVIAELGASPRRYEYPMSKAVGEVRAGLKRYHPMPQSGDARIRELTWEQSRYFVTAWLHQTNGQWVVFYSLRYGKNVQFCVA
jgi:hypothetical protein